MPNDYAWYWRHLLGLRNAMWPYVLETGSGVVWLGSLEREFSAGSARKVVWEPCVLVDWKSVVWFQRDS